MGRGRGRGKEGKGRDGDDGKGDHHCCRRLSFFPPSSPLSRADENCLEP